MTSTATHKKRKSGVPTGNAGEYFVKGELLRRGYDAQLAHRNTKGYDMLLTLLAGPRYASKPQAYDAEVNLPSHSYLSTKDIHFLERSIELRSILPRDDEL